MSAAGAERAGDTEGKEKRVQRRALLSVTDKTGVVEFARGLEGLERRVASGEMARVRWFARQARREVGFPPGHTVWLAGMLASHGHLAEAGRALESFADSPDEMRRVVAQFPSIILDRAPRDLSLLARELRQLEAGGGQDAGATLLKLARLCFTFRKMEQAARLYRGAAGTLELPVLDSVAMLYASARTDPGIAVAGLGAGELARLVDAAAAEPDALAMLAHVALATGDGELATVAMGARSLKTS